MIRKMSAVLAAVAAVVIVSQGHASTYTWSSGTAWNNATTWGGAGYPNAQSDVANVNASLAGGAAVNLALGQPITIGALNIGDPSGSFSYTISNSTNTLTFDNTGATPAGPAQLNLVVPTAGTSFHGTSSISSPVVLNSDLNVNLGTYSGASAAAPYGSWVLAAAPTNYLALTFGGTKLDIGSKTVTFTGGYTTTGGSLTTNINSGTDLVGSGTFIDNANSGFVLNAPNTGVFTRSFTGKLVVNGNAFGSNASSFNLNGSLANASEIEVNGAFDTSNGGNPLGGRLWIGNGGGSSLTYVPNNRLTSHTLTFNGGSLYDQGQGLSGAAAGSAVTDNVNTINFKSGSSLINVLAYSTTTASTTLHATTVTRTNFGTVQVTRSNTTQTGYFMADNGATLFVGQNGGVGTTNVGVIPWMLGNSGSNVYNGLNLATYDPATGFRALKAGEYTAMGGSLTTAANGNTNAVGTTGNTTASLLPAGGSNVSVNALMTSNAGTVVNNYYADMGAGNTLTIQSGALVFNAQGNYYKLGRPGQASAGTVVFGNEAVVWVAGTEAVTIGAAMSGSNGLTKAGVGTLILAGANSITGDTHVTGGILQIGDGAGNNSTLGAGSIYVDGGATLSLQSANVLASTSDLYLQTAGTSGILTGKLIMNGDETFRSLTIGGVLVGAGSYTAGSYPSGLITGAGTLTVVPEPTTVAAFGFVSLLAIARRRQRRA